MRIESAQRTNSAGNTRRRTSATGGDGFFIARPDEKPAAQAARGSASLAGIEALIMLQEVEDATVRKRRAVKRGHDLLDLLESVKLDLIAGIDNPAVLTRLGELARRERDRIEDPGLSEVLEHIELRAAVELAKRGLFRG